MWKLLARDSTGKTLKEVGIEKIFTIKDPTLYVTPSLSTFMICIQYLLLARPFLASYNFGQ